MRKIAQWNACKPDVVAFGSGLFAERAGLAIVVGRFPDGSVAIASQSMCRFLTSQGLHRMVRSSKLKEIIRFSALAGLNRSNKQASPSLLCLVPWELHRQSPRCP